MKRLFSLLAALAISLPLFSQEYVGDSVRAWQALEDKYWIQFGMGF